ncbi:hypothetical protein R6Q59_016491 [Mikania micrantha]|uniref:Uncharacterized protein n=1 Tax=Mikania micrantha TaxID=192012 RepID=A0A5N6PMY0_9ASTR|nr:hypothetical protein E3N88_09721 [Mikania micrantha]
MGKKSEYVKRQQSDGIPVVTVNLESGNFNRRPFGPNSTNSRIGNAILGGFKNQQPAKSELDSRDEYGRFEEVDDSFSNTPTKITGNRDRIGGDGLVGDRSRLPAMKTLLPGWPDENGDNGGRDWRRWKKIS